MQSFSGSERCNEFILRFLCNTLFKKEQIYSFELFGAFRANNSTKQIFQGKKLNKVRYIATNYISLYILKN